MTATRIGSLDLCLITLLTAALAALAPRADAPPVASMPDPSPEPLSVSLAETTPMGCNAYRVSAVVFHGKVTALDSDEMATFHFRFADMPSRYTVMTGRHGAFEVRVPRDELGDLDLCALPLRGVHPAVAFKDAQMTVEYELSFEY